VESVLGFMLASREDDNKTFGLRPKPNAIWWLSHAEPYGQNEPVDENVTPFRVACDFILIFGMSKVAKFSEGHFKKKRLTPKKLR
jgi:hypothetical protein